jgi:Skp family chaperone for outer membrane proteins
MEDINIKLDTLKKEKESLAKKIQKNERELEAAEEKLQETYEQEKTLPDEQELREEGVSPHHR